MQSIVPRLQLSEEADVAAGAGAVDACACVEKEGTVLEMSDY